MTRPMPFHFQSETASLHFTFKNAVEANYAITEVDAGWRDWVKKAVGALIGVVVFSQGAKGMELKNPEKLAQKATQLAESYAHEDHSEHKYKVEMDVSHPNIGDSKIKAQRVIYKIMRDGKQMGTVFFTGVDQEKLLNSAEQVNYEDFAKGSVTKDSDGIAKVITQALVSAIRDKM